MLQVRCEIVRCVARDFPEVVEARFVDADGTTWSIIDKLATFTDADVDVARDLPVQGALRCELVGQPGDTGPMVVDLLDAELEDGRRRFAVTAEQLLAPARFWDMLGTKQELRVITELLERGFPRSVAILRSALETADPYDTVYPGNPGEYDDAIREILVLLAWQNGDLSLLDRETIQATLTEGLTRCFGGEAPDERRLRRAVTLIEQRLDRSA